MTQCVFVTDKDEYECPLTEGAQVLAKQELRETPHTRDHALGMLREWAETNPRLQAVRFDASFFLRFLRAKKFSVPLTQEAVERYILLRHAYGIVFKDLDVRHTSMKELITLGYLFACPRRDSKGRRVIVTRPGVFDPYKWTNVDMCRIHGLSYETLLECEENQVRGFVHFVDGAGVGFPHLTLFTPKEAVRIVKNGERTLPMRHKEIYAINVHPSLKFALDFGMGLVSEKIRTRVNMYTCLEEVKNLDMTLLPREYGGTMPMAEMIELWRGELEEHRDILLNNDKMVVRLDMYSAKAREGAVSALKQPLEGCCEQTDNLGGVAGSFRKLEVD